MHPERGAHLFRVPYNPRSAYWLAAGVILLTVPGIIDAYRRQWAIGKLVIAGAYLALYGILAFRARRVDFYENGIYFPGDSSGLKPRFIAWSAIERFHWDGDSLTVVPFTSILYSGGEPPAAGGTAMIPTSRRAEVERLLTRAAAAR
jgi:hypothetical protein